MAQDGGQAAQGTEPGGWGADVGRAERPGVPRERDAAGLGGDGAAVVDAGGVGRVRRRAAYTAPVEGSGPPARRLSGALRRLAYRLPEHRSARWALLLGADRVDVLEHRLGMAVWLVPAAAALALGYRGVSRLLRD